MFSLGRVLEKDESCAWRWDFAVVQCMAVMEKTLQMMYEGLFVLLCPSAHKA